MSPHTDAGALLPANILDAELIVRMFTFDGADSLRARKALEKIMTFARQAASHGSAGGERSEVQTIELMARESDAEIARITGLLFDQINENKSLRAAQARQVPWRGNLSVDLRKGALRVNADGVTLIDEAGICWAIVFPDTTGSYDHASTIVSALAVPSTSRGTEANPADEIIGEIEKRFPDWRGFRDLVDCIDVTMHRLRGGQ